MTALIHRGAANNVLPIGFNDDEADPPVTPLTREQAQMLRARQPMLSPWWVVSAQLAVGAVVATGALWWSASSVAMWSAAYGALVVVLPSALMARGLTSRMSRLSPGASAARVMLWSTVKTGLSIALLMLAPKLVQPLSWAALLTSAVLCMQVYWFALLWRAR